MSWDKNQHGHKDGYDYRSIRVGDRVRKVYPGRGQQADIAVRQTRLAGDKPTPLEQLLV